MNRPPTIPEVGFRYDKPSIPEVGFPHCGSGLPPIQNHSDSRHDGRAVLRTAARKAARGQAPKKPPTNARAGWLLLPPLLPIAPVGWWLVARVLRPVDGFGLVGLLLLLVVVVVVIVARGWWPPRGGIMEASATDRPNRHGPAHELREIFQGFFGLRNHD